MFEIQKLSKTRCMMYSCTQKHHAKNLAIRLIFFFFYFILQNILKPKNVFKLLFSIKKKLGL